MLYSDDDILTSAEYLQVNVVQLTVKAILPYVDCRSILMMVWYPTMVGVR